MSEINLKPLLTLTNDLGYKVGEDRFRLLAAIAEHGSISQAAKAVGLSYKAAWDAINAMNNLFPSPVVTGKSGGKHGGGAQVTAIGQQALVTHQKLSQSLARVMEQLEKELTESASETLSPLLWSFAMRTSARNTYHGVIDEIVPGAVNTEICLKISDSARLAIIVTNESARALGLYQGREAFALIKASSPILVGGQIATSARNQLPGVVSNIALGAVNAEVTLDLGDGKSLVAIVTNESVKQMALTVGSKLFAVIKASQIILGTE
ncbi:TOBE domain-containing protein [Halioxenophilus sp. WMMB6]|uniref:TOBE domain-containing protein n=1 Tax=Halioxenophilus sp. WMMB6 TaxID=3073815 RepID=UPI00295F5403|nr:TOBE domain-containing protein [Halioxenophilus sp. WMMB6]